MWLYLKTGFYSIVHKPPCKQDELLVRARSKYDISELQKQLKAKYQFSGKIIDSPKADYAYRMIVPRKTFASYIANVVMELDYYSFKDALPSKDDLRFEAYLKCWNAMHFWQANI